jgi:hypothetical protein
MASKSKDALGGALGGAATGAAIGSIVPGIGTGIGAAGGALMGGLGGMLGDDGSADTLAQLQKNQELFGNLNTPDLNWQNFNPEQYSYEGDYNPELAQATLTQDDPALVSAQQTALNQMAGLANTGLSDADKATFEMAGKSADQEAHSGEQSAIQNAQMRGMGGSGMEFALGEQARQAAADRQQTAGLQQAATAAQQRALYNQAYLSGLGSMRDQGYRTDSGNSNVLNQFNMANTQAQNQYGYDNTQNRQSLNNQNVALNNNAAMYNQQGNIGLQQQKFQNQLQKTQGQAGANTAVGQANAAQGAAAQSQWNSNMGTAMQGIGMINSQQNNQGLIDALTKKGTTNGTATTGS